MDSANLLLIKVGENSGGQELPVLAEKQSKRNCQKITRFCDFLAKIIVANKLCDEVEASLAGCDRSGKPSLLSFGANPVPLDGKQSAKGLLIDAENCEHILDVRNNCDFSSRTCLNSGYSQAAFLVSYNEEPLNSIETTSIQKKSLGKTEAPSSRHDQIHQACFQKGFFSRGNVASVDIKQNQEAFIDKSNGEREAGGIPVSDRRIIVSSVASEVSEDKTLVVDVGGAEAKKESVSSSAFDRKSMIGLAYRDKARILSSNFNAAGAGRDNNADQSQSTGFEDIYLDNSTKNRIQNGADSQEHKHAIQLESIEEGFKVQGSRRSGELLIIAESESGIEVKASVLITNPLDEAEAGFLERGFLADTVNVEGRTRLNVGKQPMMKQGFMENVSLELSSQGKASDSPQIIRTEPLLLNRQFIIEQIMEGASNLLKRGDSRIFINLEPPNLGTLSMEVSVKNDMVRLFMVADGAEVRNIVQANLDQLRTALQGQGLSIDRFDILVQDRSNFSQSDFHQRHGAMFGEGQNNKANRENDLSPSVNLSTTDRGIDERFTEGGISLIV